MPTLPMDSYKWLFFYALLWIGCNKKLQKPPNKDAMPIADTVSTRFPPNVYWVNTGGLVYADSFRLDSLGNDLFQDRKGNVFFKTYDAEQFPVLISRFYNAGQGDSTLDLKHHLDLKTFQSLGYDYYKDKNAVYYFYQMVDGGTFSKVEADAATFHHFPYSAYGKDHLRVYYRGSKLERADSKTFQCIYRINGKDTSRTSFGKDKRYYFWMSDTCSIKDLD